MNAADLLYGDYRNRRNPLEAIDQWQNPPTVFRHGEWELVANLPQQGSDGQPVKVYECRLPARFYKLEAIELKDKPGFVLSTGSGDEMGKLIAQIALAVSYGMIGIVKQEKTDG